MTNELLVFSAIIVHSLLGGSYAENLEVLSTECTNRLGHSSAAQTDSATCEQDHSTVIYAARLTLMIDRCRQAV